MTPKAHLNAILKLGVPLIGGYLGQIAIGVTDTLMLGWYSIDALAAVTLGSTYFFVLFIFGAGFANAVMPMVATFAAEEDEVGIRRATRMGLWLSFAFCLLALPAMLWSEPILASLGQDPSVAKNAGIYLRVAGWGILPGLVVMVLKSYLAALERTQIVFWITVLAALVNAITNYALIFGNWGAPELGIMGAAWASFLTQVVSAIAVVIYILIVLPHHQMFVRIWRSDWNMLVRVFELGWPIGLTGLSEVGLFAASAVMMGWFGTIALAAHGIIVQIASVTFMLHLGLSAVATIRAGNAYGRQDRAHMARGALVVTGLSLTIAAVTILAFVGMPNALISIFMQPGETAREEILAIGVGLLFMAGLFQLVDGAQAVALGLLRGVQDTQVPMWIAAFSYWIVGVPCSYVLGFVLGWEGIGIWAGLGIGLGVAAIMLNWRFWKTAIKAIGVQSQA